MKQLKMAIENMNEFLIEEYGYSDFHTQKLAKEIFRYFTGNYNLKTEKWFKNYGHLFLGWNNIVETYEKVEIKYFVIKNRK